MMHIPDGRLVIVGAQRVQVRSSRSRVRITLQELFLIWLGGRITSPRVWFGAGGQGVTLKLAWGPSNSSPWNLLFVFAVFSIFFFLLSSSCLFFTVFFFWAVMFLGHCGIFSKSNFSVAFFFLFFSRYYKYFSLFFMLLLQLSFNRFYCLFTIFLIWLMHVE